jgi:hypothetical protein
MPLPLRQRPRPPAFPAPDLIPDAPAPPARRTASPPLLAIGFAALRAGGFVRLRGVGAGPRAETLKSSPASFPTF